MQRLITAIIFSLFLHTAWAVPVFHVDTQHKNGQDVGIELGKGILDKIPDFGAQVDKLLASHFDTSTYQTLLANIKNFRVKIPKAYQDELEGLATIVVSTANNQLGDGKLSFDELWAFQHIFDKNNVINGSGLGVFGDLNGLQTPIIGRNVEIEPNDALRALQAITVYKNPLNTVVNIGFAGYLGVISGFNSDGLYVGYFSAGGNNLVDDVDELVKQSATFMLRKALETGKNIGQATSLLIHDIYYSPHNILLADPKNINVLEYSNTTQIRQADSPLQTEMPWHNPQQLAVLNCFVHRDSPANCIDMADRARWNQFDSLANFSPETPANALQIMQIMRNQENIPSEAIFTKNTLQSMVFEPKTRRLFLYNQTDKTAEPPEYPLFADIDNLVATPESYLSLTQTDYIFIIALFLSMVAIMFWVARIRW
ncbi:C45 family autoproteolytic acyltransferase/hydolase [Beggiatoa leptomitoformis]|uniref:Peptidase C45 hydrolase domain-containing protein n=1 Tax=Beggiatoa leptomitoformis TaxID=288004 RepID=A0A2N9YDJ0_9GAMM|nr:C45 family autoproteolytic acyltransferase/hydolase [Beggiatoa leptomitoformis]ALG69064.1 hypothetical protein AL038_16955 [Beggiatoa leptomitoformis]AUI68526.1 hypothetical protein BLE401_07285 [Beggiatoa leptomitoformis]